MRKAFRLLLPVCLLICLCCGALAAEDAPSGLRAEWTAAASGELSCELTITCTFPSAAEDFTLSLPEGAQNITVYNLRSEIRDGVVRILADSAFTGQTTFRLRYELPGALDRGAEEGQVLSLPLVPEGLGVEIGYVEFSLSLPKTYENEPDFYIGSARTDGAVYTLDDTRIAGTLQESVPAGQGLSLRLVLDSGYFTKGKSLRLFSSWRVLIVLVLLLAVGYWYLTMFRGGARVHVKSRVLPPDGVASGDLPCLLSGAPGDPAALLTQWASLGYVRLEQDGSRVRVRALMGMDSERRGFERSLFARLFRDSGAALSSSRGYAAAMQTAAARLRTHWTRKLFDRRSGSPLLLRALCALLGALCGLSGFCGRGVLAGLAGFVLGLIAAAAVQAGTLQAVRRGKLGWIVAGVAAAVAHLALLPLGGMALLLSLAVQLLCGLAVSLGGRRSALGAELLEQTLGFRRYLLSLTEKKLRRLLRQDGQYFYRLLPYAEALGCGRAFASRFGSLRLERCDWLDSNAQTAAAFYAQYAALMAQLRRGISGK